MVSGVLGVAGISSVVAGLIDMRVHDSDGTPWLAGHVPALLGTAAFFRYLRCAGRVQGLRRGEGLVARWTVPADEFRRFCEAEARTPVRSGWSTATGRPSRSRSRGRGAVPGQRRADRRWLLAVVAHRLEAGRKRVPCRGSARPCRGLPERLQTQDPKPEAALRLTGFRHMSIGRAGHVFSLVSGARTAPALPLKLSARRTGSGCI